MTLVSLPPFVVSLPAVVCPGCGQLHRVAELRLCGSCGWSAARAEEEGHAEWACPACGAEICAIGAEPPPTALERYCLECQARAAGAPTNVAALELGRAIGRFLAAWDSDSHVLVAALDNPGGPVLEQLGNLRRVHAAWKGRHG